MAGPIVLVPIVKQTLKQHVNKLNKIKFQTKSFETQCVIIHALLNQGALASHCSFIGMNHAGFDSHCLSNMERVYSEILSPKHHSQVSFDKTCYQDAVLVSFAATPPVITTGTHTGEQISSP